MGNRSIGVITMFRDNYGAFLQAYSLQRILNSMGYSAELIDYDNSREKTILGVPIYGIKKPNAFIKRVLVEIIMHKKHTIRKKVFEKSIKNNLKLSEMHYESYKELKANPPRYDLYLTGSDQVFNPNLEPQSFMARLLAFADGDKISYSASAGNVKNVLGRYDELVKNLRLFKKVSVREYSLKVFLNEKAHIEATQNIDPTLLLDEKQWREFEKQPEYLSGDYIFYYRVLVQPELQEYAEALSKNLNIPVFAADGNARFNNQIERRGFLSPEEWVGALANAQYVITNSFHGAVFSINMGKKVRIVLPPDNTERIEDIVQKSNLQRLYDDELLKDEELNELYSNAKNYIKKERKKTFEFLSTL